MTYTPYAGDAGVRSAVAANLGATLGIEAESDNVLLTPGTPGHAAWDISVCASHRTKPPGALLSTGLSPR
jgi:DNA-binding transcriptional MocR family regulator